MLLLHQAVVRSLYLFPYSYRFMDLFPEAGHVREAQKELDEIIQQGVFQITRLLKNTEASQEGGDAPSYTMRRTATHVKEPRLPSSSRGRLTDRLLAQGLLTPGMLSELRKEWDAQSSPSSKEAQEPASDSDDEDNYSGKGGKLRRKRRK